jgi:demethylspheroidene O-methyltransferase
VSRDTFFDFRNRLLGSERFRNIAQKIPFIQWVARRRANALFRLCSGFIHSQVMLACVRLKLFEKLRGGAQEVAVLAAECGASYARRLRCSCSRNGPTGATDSVFWARR